LVNGICAGFDVSADIRFNPENAGYPVTFNTEAEPAIALKAAMAVAGENALINNQRPAWFRRFCLYAARKAGLLYLDRQWFF